MPKPERGKVWLVRFPYLMAQVQEALKRALFVL